MDCQEVASGPVLGFAVADGDGADQVGVVKHSAERMGDGIAQLAAFVDGTGGLGRNVGRDAAGEAELLEQLAHALFITADVGVHFAVGAVQVGVGNKEVAAVARAGDQDHVLVILLDDAVQMYIDEVLAGNGAPVADDLLLDIVARQRAAQQRVVQQIQLARRQVVRCPPVGVDLFQCGLIQHTDSSLCGGIYGKNGAQPRFSACRAARSACSAPR